MKIRKRQTRLALVKIVAALVVLGIGYTVWFAYHSAQVADKTLQSANKVSSDVPKVAAITTFDTCKKSPGSKLLQTSPEQCVAKSGKTFTDPTPVKYLVVKEWGVKVPLSAEISDAVYLIKPDVPGGAYLSLTSLARTRCTAANVSMGAYIRFTKNETWGIENRKMLEIYPSAAKVGNYYYAYERAQDGCSEQIGAARMTSIQNAFETAIKGVVAD